MSSFDRINRRTHLYLGLILFPWVLMYGVSSFVISHHESWFKSSKQPVWEPLFERAYKRAIPDDAISTTEAGRTILRAVAMEILKENNLEGAFYSQRPSPDEVRINRNTFFDQTRLIYSIKDQTLRAERQRSSWDGVVQRMHTRNGYNHPLFLTKLWAFTVDLTCVTMIVWVASGIIMWWRLAKVRVWGAIALAGGAASFLLLALFL
jgi:hypothetical protein